MTAKFKVMLALTGWALSQAAVAGERFDRVLGVFDAAVSIAPESFSGDHAYAGYCIRRDDDTDDALFAFRTATDPIMGQTVKALELQVEGSSNTYVRMEPEAIKKEIDESDASLWNDGSWNGDELLSRVHWRFMTIVRLAYTADRADTFYVSKKMCKSIDGRACNGSDSAPYMTYEACYYFSKKF